MEKEEGSRRPGNKHRAKEAVDWAEMGPSRSAQAGRPSLFRGPITPYDLVAIRTIYSPEAKSHDESICHPPPRSREERDTVPERRGSRWLTRVLPYGRPWAHCLSGYQDRLLGGPLGLLGLGCTTPVGVERKDLGG
jgi:hypothetical protein